VKRSKYELLKPITQSFTDVGSRILSLMEISYDKIEY
jgi:hypothetical protein